MADKIIEYLRLRSFDTAIMQIMVKSPALVLKQILEPHGAPELPVVVPHQKSREEEIYEKMS